MKLKVIVAICILFDAYWCNPLLNLEWGVPQRNTVHPMVRGSQAKAQDFPWHATLFHKIDDVPSNTSNFTWEYKCGGSLISERFVLTAKHCTQDDRTEVRLPFENMLIKFGLQKYAEMNEHFQDREVLKIYFPKEKYWEGQSNDIALIELKEDVQITHYVLPVLLVDQEPTVGTNGITVGFGYTKNRTVSDTLRKLEMPIIDPRKCFQRHPHIQLDMGRFCAGHIDGRTACNGDSGGGIVFLNKRKFYLGGIVSYSDKQEDTTQDTCRLDGYTIFTNVHNYLPWIMKITKLNDTLAGIAVIDDFSCGVPKVRRSLRLRRVVNGQGTVPGQWPWHAKIYHKKDSMEYVCGGSLINERFVITADFCVLNEEGNIKKISVIFVQLGAHKLREPNQEYKGVEKIYVPGIENKPEFLQKIALLQLLDEIIFTNVIRPVCLPTTDIVIGAYGTAIGFGFTEMNESPETLKMAQLPTIGHWKCYSKFESTDVLREDMFCAGHLNGTTICNGDAGGGIHFKGDDDAWYIGGISIMSRFEPQTFACDHYSYAGFTNVFKYISWIRTVIDSVDD